MCSLLGYTCFTKTFFVLVYVLWAGLPFIAVGNLLLQSLYTAHVTAYQYPSISWNVFEHYFEKWFKYKVIGTDEVYSTCHTV